MDSALIVFSYREGFLPKEFAVPTAIYYNIGNFLLILRMLCNAREGYNFFGDHG
jgi:hypothetical protein